jgi:hypothetical protein
VKDCITHVLLREIPAATCSQVVARVGILPKKTGILPVGLTPTGEAGREK